VVHSVFRKQEEPTAQIIGAAMAVSNELKPGLDEKLYENALVVEANRDRAGGRTTDFPDDTDGKRKG